VTSIQISVALEVALDERIVIIGFGDVSRASVNPYRLWILHSIRKVLPF
jgi:hypothetical protein